jgi:hypothetical protein
VSCQRRQDTCILRFPFKFTIPQQLISARSDVHPDFLNLCPTIRANHAFTHPSTSSHSCKPWISYSLKISHIYAETQLPSIRCGRAREIIIMPFTYAAPPIEINHHPHEYKSMSTKAIRHRIFSHGKCHLTLSATEPDPINLVTGAPRAATTISMNLSLSLENRTQVDIFQQKLIVKSRLRIRTFCTTRKLTRIPTLVASKNDPSLQMVEHKTSWEIRESVPVEWKKQLSEVGSDENREIWTADWRSPVSVPKTLLPTFLNLLSARQYAIELRVSLATVRHIGMLELAIPLQLIYHDLKKKALEGGDNLACDIQDAVEW